MLLWHPSDPDRIPLALETEHRANLFGVQFLPHSNNSKIVTGAMDSTVQLLELEGNPAAAPPAWRRRNGSAAGGGRRHAGAGGAGAAVRAATPRATVFCCHTNRVKVRGLSHASQSAV